MDHQNDDITIALKFYEAARTELVQRVALRDHVLLAFLAFSGAAFGVAVATQPRWEVMLVLPYLAVGCAVLVSQHNVVIGTLISFINRDLCDKTPLKAVPEFVNSASFKDHSERSNRLRTAGHGFVLIVPSITSVAVNHAHFQTSEPLLPYGLILVGSVLATVGSAVVIHYGHRQRDTVYVNTVWWKTPPATRTSATSEPSAADNTK